ncbi:MAG: TOBE domain-containing protein [Pelagimonas sp.]|jgi:multiple sugar transport system ATP-binding protein|nr:TOBE domain-containing protein [Pelagimonas sp.]
MNFLPSTKTEGGRWSVAGQAYQGSVAADGAIEFATRPEDIAPSDTGLPAKVRLVEPLGAHLLATCDVQGTMFRAILESDLQVKA